MKHETSRRQLLTGIIALVAAPAIVRASSLMPVSSRNLFAPHIWIYSDWVRVDNFWWRRTLLNPPRGARSLSEDYGGETDWTHWQFGRDTPSEPPLQYGTENPREVEFWERRQF